MTNVQLPLISNGAASARVVQPGHVGQLGHVGRAMRTFMGLAHFWGCFLWRLPRLCSCAFLFLSIYG